MVPGQSLQIVKWISEIKMPTLMEIIKVGIGNWAEILLIIPLNIMGTIWWPLLMGQIGFWFV